MMNLTVANISKNVGSAAFQAAIAAIGRQVNEHFQPEWGIAATVTGTTLSLADDKAPIDGDHDAIIYLGDAVQDPTTGVENALGYHFANHAKIPYGFVYLDICAEYGEPWSCTLSHEVLELLADPTATHTVTGPPPAGVEGNVAYDLEVCDPTQGDTYQIDAVVVSNFVGPGYFEMPGGSGRSNYLDLPLVPFGVRPKGYFQYENSGGVQQVQGAQVTAEQLAAKQKMGRGRRNWRRRERHIEMAGRRRTV
jgi:hypothetical protein